MMMKEDNYTTETLLDRDAFVCHMQNVVQNRQPLN